MNLLLFRYTAMYSSEYSCPLFASFVHYFLNTNRFKDKFCINATVRLKYLEIFSDYENMNALINVFKSHENFKSI